jgi:uncharacterized protein (TIGR04255 family)
MNLDLLQPFAGIHAVQNVALAAEWQGDLSDQTLLRIHALGEDFKPYFQKVDLQKMMQINLTPTEIVSQPSALLGGVVFQRISDLGTVSRQIQVNRQNCSFIINDYDRWAPTLEIAMEYFKKIFPIILADKAISAIALQYTDSFTWKDDPELLDLKVVFNEKTPYLAPNVFDAKHAWHSHHGFIYMSTDPVDHESLDNINVNVADAAGERTIQITTVNRASFKKPLRLSMPNYMGVVEALESVLHDRSKMLLGSLLSPAVAKKISLKQGG